MSDFDEATQRRIEATHEMAVVLCDDVRNMRSTLLSPLMNAGDVRRLSGPFRRILLDKGGDLAKVAPSRMGRYKINAPDLNVFYQENKKNPFVFYCGGQLTVLGSTIGDMQMRKHGSLVNLPHSMIDVSLDGFINQRVMCLNGKWVSRRDVITYVSNVTSGVHSGVAFEPSHLLINEMRNLVRLRLSPSQICSIDLDPLHFGPHVFVPIKFDKEKLDVAGIQLLSSVNYFVNSEAIKKLEQIVEREA